MGKAKSASSRKGAQRANEVAKDFKAKHGKEVQMAAMRDSVPPKKGGRTRK